MVLITDKKEVKEKETKIRFINNERNGKTTEITVVAGNTIKRAL